MNVAIFGLGMDLIMFLHAVRIYCTAVIPLTVCLYSHFWEVS